MLMHSKVSGQVNADADRVGGEDWDAPHAWANQSMVPLGAIKIMWDATGSWIYGSPRTSRLGAATRNAAGDYRFDVDVSGIQLAASCTATYFCVVSACPRGAIPSGMSFSASCDEFGAGILEVTNLVGDYVDPTIWIDFYITIYADVQLSSGPI